MRLPASTGLPYLLTGILYDDEASPRYAYEYGANGQVARVRDNLLNRVHESEYDLALQPKRATTLDAGGNLLYQATLRYNKYGQLVTLGERVQGESYRTGFEYDNDDRVTQIAYDDQDPDDKRIDRGVSYGYDRGLGRLDTKTLVLSQALDEKGKPKAISREVQYGYLDVAGQTKRTTPMVASIRQSADGASDLDFAYEYDTLGNIVKETRGGIEVSYQYDKLGQLLRVNDPTDPTMGEGGTTWTYEYDLGGNIVKKTAHVLTLEAEIPIPGEDAPQEELPRETDYAYGNAAWKDQLTGFGGKAITYDAIGNPLTYGQRNERTFTWQGGRRLAHMTVRPDAAEHGEAWVELDAMDIYHAEGDNGARFVATGGELDASIEGYRLQNGWLEVDGVSEALALDFAYDAAGLRTQKVATTDDGAVTTTDYFLHGKLLMELQEQGPKGAKRLHFYYDAAGKPQMVKLGDNYYTYLHNLQGDIVAIVDSVGSTVVEYGYDAWGKPTKTASKAVEGDSTLTTEYAELARLNPFRYSGYIYDMETGYYYLRSRYYDPNWGRFLNADGIINIECLLGSNQFAYCYNNPVTFIDSSGDMPILKRGKQDGNGYTYISQLQTMLNRLGYTGIKGSPLPTEGKFGKNTVYAVKQYQSANGLDIDGIVGPKTWESIVNSFDAANNTVTGYVYKSNVISVDNGTTLTLTAKIAHNQYGEWLDVKVFTASVYDPMGGLGIDRDCTNRQWSAEKSGDGFEITYSLNFDVTISAMFGPTDFWSYIRDTLTGWFRPVKTTQDYSGTWWVKP